MKGPSEQTALSFRALPRLRRASRHDPRLQRALRRQEGRRAKDRDRRRRPPARQLFVPGQRPRAGPRGGNLARAGWQLQELSPARKDDLRRRARRALLGRSRSGELALAYGARHARAGRGGDLPADLRQPRSQRDHRARDAEGPGWPTRRPARRRIAKHQAQGSAHRPRRAGARRRAVCDLRNRPAAGLCLARRRRRHAPLCQHQCGRQPSRRRRIRKQHAGARAPAERRPKTRTSATSRTSTRSRCRVPSSSATSACSTRRGPPSASRRTST